jgi:hypothetical protein
MKHQLPPGAQDQLNRILEKLLGLLATAGEQTSARSEFMNYDGSMGGQVLETDPAIEHPYEEVSDLYVKMFERAKEERLELREIETLFERKTPAGPWTTRTRWLEVGEFKAFTKAIAPSVDALGATLRRLGAETASDWYKASFDPGPDNRRLLVLHGNRVRVVKEPTPELMEHASQISQAARAADLVVVGAGWSVSNDEEDEVDSTVRVLHAWPTDS